MSVILNPSLCHSERSEESPFVAQGRLREESPFFAQDKLREESHGINELKMEILRLQPQNDIMTQSLKGRGNLKNRHWNYTAVTEHGPAAPSSVTCFIPYPTWPISYCPLQIAHLFAAKAAPAGFIENRSYGVMELWSTGVLEYRSTGVQGFCILTTVSCFIPHPRPHILHPASHIAHTAAPHLPLTPGSRSSIVPETAISYSLSHKVV